MILKEGTILLCNWNNLAGKIVRFYNRMIYNEVGWSHVAIITEVKDNEVLVHEALSDGFKATYYDKNKLFEEYKSNRCKFGETTIKLKDVKLNAGKYLGKGYAYTDIFFILIKSIIGFNWTITGERRLICSEAIARILYDASNKKIVLGYKDKSQKKDSEFKKKFDLITPQDIAKSKYIKFV